MFEKDIEVGDKVWDFIYGWGEVIRINPLDNFPIIVKFGDIKATYAYSGVANIRYTQTLFWDEIRFEIPERPKPKFKIGDWAVEKHRAKPLLVTDQNIRNINAGTSHTLWQPREGEWCAFYDDNEYLVAKFERSIESKHYPQGRGWFGNVAPLELIKTLKGE